MLTCVRHAKFAKICSLHEFVSAAPCMEGTLGEHPLAVTTVTATSRFMCRGRKEAKRQRKANARGSDAVVALKFRCWANSKRSKQLWAAVVLASRFSIPSMPSAGEKRANGYSAIKDTP